uniref:Uncharacterized protein n=1 Tax=Romanomermis culicivorax TaxID=13658 RepID=A0A915KDF8_ROMCU
MKEKIEILEKEKYGKAATELVKRLENANVEEEISEEPFVEIVSEIGKRKNWRHRTEIKNESTKVGKGTKNAVKSQCLKKRGEKKMMKSRRATDRKNGKGERNPGKGNAKEKKTRKSIKIAESRGVEKEAGILPA